jgi:hypothetical protein
MSAKQRAAALRNLRKARRARSGKRRRRNPVAAVAGNPRRRKRRRSRGVFRMRRRRNPAFSLRRLSPRALLANVQPALVGGAGAVANDLVYSFIASKLPTDTMPFLENFKSGMLRHVGKAASAMLLATLAGMVLPRRLADQLGTGALTVVGYNVVRDGLAKVAPDLTLGMYLDPGLGYAGAGWNPTYGSDWRAKSGLSAYLRANGNGNSGNPGTVRVPSQFSTRDQFGTRGGMSVQSSTGT